MAAPVPSPTLPFIVTCSADKADAATRRLIRSHVMRGKNLKRPGPRKRQLQMLGKEQCDKSQSACHNHVDGTPFGAEELHLELICRYDAPVPRRVGSDFSFVEFADDIELEMVVNVMRCACTCP